MTHSTRSTKIPLASPQFLVPIIGTTLTIILCTIMLRISFSRHQNNTFHFHLKPNETVRFYLTKQGAYYILTIRIGLNVHLNIVASRSHSSDPSLLKMISVIGLCKKLKTVMRCITKSQGDNRISVLNIALMDRIGLKCAYLG